MDKVTQQNAAALEEMSATSEEPAAQQARAAGFGGPDADDTDFRNHA